MTDDLKARLRRKTDRKMFGGPTTYEFVNPDGPEAADRIEELERYLEACRWPASLIDANREASKRAEAAERERDEARAEVEAWRKWIISMCNWLSEAGPDEYENIVNEVQEVSAVLTSDQPEPAAADADTVRVPREPTQAMVDAGVAAWHGHTDPTLLDDEVAAVYRAMLAAADRDRT